MIGLIEIAILLPFEEMKLNSGSKSNKGWPWLR